MKEEKRNWKNYWTSNTHFFITGNIISQIIPSHFKKRLWSTLRSYSLYFLPWMILVFRQCWFIPLMQALFFFPPISFSLTLIFIVVSHYFAIVLIMFLLFVHYQVSYHFYSHNSYHSYCLVCVLFIILFTTASPPWSSLFGFIL